MNTSTAPRVNQKLLSKCVGKTVALVGSMESHTPTAVALRSSDGMIVNVQPKPGSDYGSKYVEVIGRVLENGTIEEFKVTLFGEKFDMETYNQMVELAHTEFRHLF